MVTELPTSLDRLDPALCVQLDLALGLPLRLARVEAELVGLQHKEVLLVRRHQVKLLAQVSLKYSEANLNLSL